MVTTNKAALAVHLDDIMKSRGEIQFMKFPRVAAWLYSKLTRTRPLQQQYLEIAAYLASRIQSGRLLDIGTGPGRLLLEVHKLSPRLQLYGLDISKAMIELAQKNLVGVTSELKMANVCAMGYETDFFDTVVCTGSFYLWDRPKQGLEEVHRILKPDCCAYLFETNRDYDRRTYTAALKANLKREGLAMRMFGPLLLAKALPMAYRSDEVEAIVKQTSFADRCRIDNVALVGLPIWMRIQLTK